MLLLTGAAGWILLAASPGELAGWPPAQAPTAQATGAMTSAPPYAAATAAGPIPVGTSAPAWPQDTTARRYDPSVQPAAHQEPAATGAANPAHVPGDSSPVPITPRSAQPSLPLSPPGATSASPSGGSGSTSVITMVASLGLVLGIFLLTAWGIRRATPQALQALPKDAFEVLGRAPLAGRQHAHLLRLGNKLVLVSLTTAGAETLAEITDPVEVDRVAGLCRQAQSGSATAAFRQVLGQFAGGEPTADADDHRTQRSPAILGTGSRYGNAERDHG